MCWTLGFLSHSAFYLFTFFESCVILWNLIASCLFCWYLMSLPMIINQSACGQRGYDTACQNNTTLPAPWFLWAFWSIAGVFVMHMKKGKCTDCGMEADLPNNQWRYEYWLYWLPSAFFKTCNNIAGRAATADTRRQMRRLKHSSVSYLEKISLARTLIWSCQGDYWFCIWFVTCVVSFIHSKHLMEAQPVCISMLANIQMIRFTWRWKPGWRPGWVLLTLFSLLQRGPAEFQIVDVLFNRFIPLSL